MSSRLAGEQVSTVSGALSADVMAGVVGQKSRIRIGHAVALDEGHYLASQACIWAGDGVWVDAGPQAEIKRLKWENAELRRANEILKAASCFRM